MHELACPSCGTTAQFNLDEMILTCQICSTSFTIDLHSGRKDIFRNHYIVPNLMDTGAVKSSVLEWLRRLHHKPGATSHEFVVLDIKGMSFPFWVVSLDVHTVWQGLIRRKKVNSLVSHSGGAFLSEGGEFRRSYRWAVNARKNICEHWGLTRLHQVPETFTPDWDGFPLDSTFSRGQLEIAAVNSKGEVQNYYDQREFFDHKFANGLPVLGVEVDEEQAIRRAKEHTRRYHYLRSKESVDYLIDLRTEHEIAGVQLVHIPIWHATYQYRPKTFLKHLYKPSTKNVVVDGSKSAIIKGEMALVHRDKVVINMFVCLAASLLFVFFGLTIHSSFFLVSLFALIVAAISGLFINVKHAKIDPDMELKHGGLGLLKNTESQVTT